MVHESRLHEDNSFVTLTYDEEHYKPSLDYRDVQLFLKRLRKKTGKKIRFFCAGEYGETTWRAHWHLIIFGLGFRDGKTYGQYRSSPLLENSWQKGQVVVADFSQATASYTAGYVLKKVTGQKATEYYKKVDSDTGEIIDLTPPFARMSLKPGIGYEYFVKHWKQFANHDSLTLPGGSKVPLPKTYDRWMMDLDFDITEHNQMQRYLKSFLGAEHKTPERLAVREYVDNQRLKFFSRKTL